MLNKHIQAATMRARAKRKAIEMRNARRIAVLNQSNEALKAQVVRTMRGMN